MATYEQGFPPRSGNGPAQSWTNATGALVSLSLIFGIGYWGYQLIMRDVTGIPVVRAIEGDMRVLPDDPGGDIARHVGLSVNELVAMGEAAAPEDRLVLAPRMPGLAREDLEAVPMASVDDVGEETMQPVALLPDAAALAVPAQNMGATVEDVLAMVTQITAEDAAPAETTVAGRVPVSVPGVALSLRPVLRPASLRTAAAGAAAASPSAPVAATLSEVPVSTASFATGTDLVQLGAFSSPALAAEEWARLAGRFGPLMAGRERVVQVSTQSSGTWYRLRASGFADRDDARRFCAALQAEGAECIAVVVN
ncbi:SPOR domain-containing protein [Yoonia vestfoldensis]|uniref:Cell division protein FtsN n=1 Tax=Yoonia vestfoldensis TaxID=245188 RepID=A0A1Y0EBH8_9RHOB|nr:SPOR domain-containing protein [Yoonia vestfoldensis]ARU00966.1 cell division protein FtsN [Yoonia vestfoldensis]